MRAGCPAAGGPALAAACQHKLDAVANTWLSRHVLACRCKVLNVDRTYLQACTVAMGPHGIRWFHSKTRVHRVQSCTDFVCDDVLQRVKLHYDVAGIHSEENCDAFMITGLRLLLAPT